MIPAASDGTLCAAIAEQMSVVANSQALKNAFILAVQYGWVHFKLPKWVKSTLALTAETQQAIPDQLNKPTARPTMRWIFQCFEGIELLHIRSAEGTQSLVLRLQPMHRLVLALLGPPYEKIYKVSS